MLLVILMVSLFFGPEKILNCFEARLGRDAWRYSYLTQFSTEFHVCLSLTRELEAGKALGAIASHLVQVCSEVELNFAAVA
ncbi:hypothetical protein NG796_19130 [Laspinema sp. A4]|uniref:hypothetical protein n=1 Tax=Laspinema sp. D2d TaxID=2953686 RepID=UPI0021BB3DA1|nr:hypothetical protein [Laspinema sp. D2d]MCT7985391.1 hypothetical protein [Laspinema sp. D2d]